MRILNALKTAVNFTSLESFTPTDFEKESNIWALSSRRTPTIPAGPRLPLAYSSTWNLRCQKEEATTMELFHFLMATLYASLLIMQDII